MGLLSDPEHPHNTRYHPGAAAAGEGAASAAAASSSNMMHGGQECERRATTQWQFGAPLEGPTQTTVRGAPTEKRAVQEAGEMPQTTKTHPHVFGAVSEGVQDEIAMLPTNPIPLLREYSGLEVAMTKLGERMFEPTIVERELLWQQEDVLSENTQAQSEFTDRFLQQQHFRAFAMMRENSPYITIVHSIGKFFPMMTGDSETAAKGIYVGFVGDRKQNRSPIAISLPQTVWGWIIPEVFLDYELLESYYEDPEAYATLFVQPPATKPTGAKGKGKKKTDESETAPQREEVAVPAMLSLPSCVMSELCARTRWTPFELLQIVNKKIIEFDMQVQGVQWKVMREWCLAATHAAFPNEKTSRLTVPVMALTDDDDDFHEWTDTRLDMTMGRRHFAPVPSPSHQHMAAAAADETARERGSELGSDLATQVGRGIALGLQTFTNAGLLNQGAGTRAPLPVLGEAAKMYSPDSIAALKGFSGTEDINELQPIWATFQTTKNLDVQRRHLAHGMEQWARMKGVELDRGIYFEQKSVEDIVNLRFNPGQGVAQFKSAEKGLSLLICRSRTPEEIERVREREEAEQLTQATRVLEEALKLQRGDPRPPASNYFELKLNITSFCALVHTLFGDKCGYYQALMRIRNCMDTAGVYNIRQAYTADVCHRIAWAVIDDGRSFFSTVLIQQDFEGADIPYPESLLDAILVDVRYANPVNRASYPPQWKPRSQAQPQMIPWTPPPGVPAPAQASGGGHTPAASGSPAKKITPWVDTRHSLIVKMMAPYIAKLGDNVYVGEILDAAGIHLSDLPVPLGTRFASNDGTKAFLCWNAVLGRCKFGSKCKYKRNHPAAGELSDTYAALVVAALQQGVTYVVSTKEASPKKAKLDAIV